MDKNKNTKKKKVSIFTVLNPVAMKREINSLEITEFSAKSYLKFLAAWYAAMLVIIFAFKLQLIYGLILLALETLLLPYVYYINILNEYELQKFIDISAYIEQILYSFKRHPKILSSLKDATLLFADKEKGKLQRAIQTAIDYIQNGVSEESIYKEAFASIEEEYGCKRLYKTHNFLVRVEHAGGRADEAIDILLRDRNLWVGRIQNLLHDKQKIRINVTIAIGLSLFVVGMSTYMVPTEFGIAQMMASQIAKTITIGLDMLIWFLVQKALSKSLLSADEDMPFEELERSYNMVMHNEHQKKKKIFSMAAGLMGGAAAVVVAIAGVNIISEAVKTSSAFSSFTDAVLFAAKGQGAAFRNSIILLVVAILFATQPKRQYKACFKRVRREVEKVFPDWLLSLALQMQTDNVYVSIAKTTVDAPKILFEELSTLQDSIEKNPEALEPYINFFKILQIPDIMTAMKMLYAMAQFGAEDSQEQIRALVDRNTEIMDKAERMRMEDHLAGITFAMLLPMITGVITMLTDLALVMGYILSQVNMPV